MDKVFVTDLLLRAIIGINPDERTKRQDVLINLTFEVDTSPAGASDDIADAFNYRTITKRVIKMVETSQFQLVEKLAEEIAMLCLADPQAQSVTVRLEKPGALRFARSVGVEIHRTQADMKARPNRVMVSMGSNIEPERNLRRAIGLLREHCTIVAVSPVYQTPAVGNTEQSDFLNATVLVVTPFPASTFKSTVLQPIEQALGRQRTEDKNAPRTIDLDISLFNYAQLTLGERAIPDPELLTMPHIAIPAADLLPWYVHPVTGETLEEISRTLPREGIIIRNDINLIKE